MSFARCGRRALHGLGMALAIWIHTYPHTPDHRLVVKIVLSNFGVFGGSASRATTTPALLTPDISVNFVQCFDVCNDSVTSDTN